MSIIIILLHIFHWFMVLYLLNGLSFVAYSSVMLFLELSNISLYYWLIQYPVGLWTCNGSTECVNKSNQIKPVSVICGVHHGV